MSLNDKLLQSATTPFVNSENFKVVTYTGDGNVGRAVNCGFKPDWIVWKRRDGSADWSNLDTSSCARQEQAVGGECLGG